VVQVDQDLVGLRSREERGRRRGIERHVVGQISPARQARQDIHWAEFLLSLGQGLTREESAGTLRYRAAADGVSLHTAALTVLSHDPSAEQVDARSPAPSRLRRHLFAVPSGHEIGAESTAEIASGS
jgi:hypothetical protein